MTPTFERAIEMVRERSAELRADTMESSSTGDKAKTDALDYAAAEIELLAADMEDALRVSRGTTL